MRVKCIANYQDLQLGKLVSVGDEINVDEARANMLINAKVAEPITTEVATESAPKKRAKASK